MTRLPKDALACLLLLTLAASVAGAEAPPRPDAVEPRTPARPRLQKKTPAEPSPKKSFLKTRRGILIVSLSAIAVSYTLWSRQRDRVQSPVR